MELKLRFILMANGYTLATEDMALFASITLMRMPVTILLFIRYLYNEP